MGHPADRKCHPACEHVPVAKLMEEEYVPATYSGKGERLRLYAPVLRVDRSSCLTSQSCHPASESSGENDTAHRKRKVALSPDYVGHVVYG